MTHGFWVLFGVQFLSYGLITLNYRAVARGDYWQTFVTDILLGTFSFVSIRQVMRANTRRDRIGYIGGGALGALTALWLTQKGVQMDHLDIALGFVVVVLALACVLTVGRAKHPPSHTHSRGMTPGQW